MLKGFAHWMLQKNISAQTGCCTLKIQVTADQSWESLTITILESTIKLGLETLWSKKKHSLSVLVTNAL